MNNLLEFELLFVGFELLCVGHLTISIFYNWFRNNLILLLGSDLAR